MTKRRFSEEHRIKISKALTGRKLSVETRNKMSIARKGENNPFYGKKHSEETIKKQSEVKKGKYIGENHPMYGKHHSEFARQLISKIQTGRKHSEEWKHNIGKSIIGLKNGMWKGDDVGYSGLHYWIRKYLPKPIDGKCELCHNDIIKEVACITNIYNRELKNWAWFCIRCHKKWDNIYERNFRKHRDNRTE